MTEKELKEILEKHIKWLHCDPGGKRADLQGAYLKRAYLKRADLQGADLRGADLQGADLRGADLQDADLDYSCLPLFCGCLSAHFDDRQIIQILYHAVKAGVQSRNVSEELKTVLYGIADTANKFHRVGECGRIERGKKDDGDA